VEKVIIRHGVTETRRKSQFSGRCAQINADLQLTGDKLRLQSAPIRVNLRQKVFVFLFFVFLQGETS
jgi:hypothetical protein